MSGRSLSISTFPGIGRYEVSVFRYTVGAVLAMAVALGFGWNLSYLVPVLSLGFYSPGATPPGFKQGLSFVGPIALASILSLLLSKFFLDYMLIFIPGLALLFLHLFYTDKLNPLLKTWLLISFLIIPMMGLKSMMLAYMITVNLIFNAVITILLVWFVYALIPDFFSYETETKATKNTSASDKPSGKERFILALERLLVVFPIVLVFFFFQWSGAMLVLIFIAILSMQPGFAKNFKVGMALIIGNVIGGVSAIILYELIVIMPEFYFLILLILFTGLIFSQKLFSGKPTAPLFGMAFSTLLLIIGQSTSGTEDAGGKVWVRVLQIMVAVVYVVLAFGLIEYFKEQKKTGRAKKLAKRIHIKSNSI